MTFLLWFLISDVKKISDLLTTFVLRQKKVVQCLFCCLFTQLHSNPWNCDCHLKNFRDWVVFRGLYTYPTSCAEPERLADKLWQDVDPKDFACKPDIQVPQSVVFSQPGANVTLSCFIIGNPMPDAKWVLKVSNTLKGKPSLSSFFGGPWKNLSLEYFSPRSVL